MTEKLEQAAFVYATLAKEMKEAERKVDIAKNCLALLREKQTTAEKELRASVGENIRRKAFLVQGGLIVTVDLESGVHVFENGVEVR